MRMTVYRKTVEILICFYTVFEVRRGEKIQIEIKIDSSCKETKIIVLTDKITDEINTFAKKFAQDTPQLLAGLQGDILKVLDQHDIIRLYATNGKGYAGTEDGEYQLRLRLHELEERLDKDDFVRISNSEIIN